MILRTFRLHSMLFHTLPNHFPTGFFNYFNTRLSISPRNHSGDGLGMFRLSKYGTRTYIHLWAFYYGLPTPLRIYTFVMILNLFYFCFIYSILYILHTLIFKNTSSHFAHTVQNRSEKLSKFARTLTSSQQVVLRLDLTRSDSLSFALASCTLAFA